MVDLSEKEAVERIKHGEINQFTVRSCLWRGKTGWL